jgi:hypothetical protein
MAYSTKEEVRQILEGLVEVGGNRDFTAAGLTDAQVEYEIGNADSQIDLALRKRGYTTPLPPPVPSIIHFLSVDIAVAQCDMIFRGSREYANENHPARMRYDRARRLLLQIVDSDYPIYNPGEGPEIAAIYDAELVNPYPGDVLETKDVFPRGAKFLRTHDGAEYAEESYPGHGGW